MTGMLESGVPCAATFLKGFLLMKMFGLILLPQFFHLTPEKLEPQELGPRPAGQSADQRLRSWLRLQVNYILLPQNSNPQHLQM